MCGGIQLEWFDHVFVCLVTTGRVVWLVVLLGGIHDGTLASIVERRADLFAIQIDSVQSICSWTGRRLPFVIQAVARPVFVRANLVSSEANLRSDATKLRTFLSPVREGRELQMIVVIKVRDARFVVDAKTLANVRERASVASVQNIPAIVFPAI